MYSITEKEKDFLNQKTKVLTSENIKEFSDRELLEKQTLYLKNIIKSNDTIKLNIQFWFYTGLIGGAILFLFLLNSNR
ncbi:hypothetical protein [Flavobacterium sp.]|uniref:hypothetical protein n=1 Tax=Flavobacterium sp. TaxID=239 RepID=UPI0032662D35